jgi:Zn-dependent peptidase ImmA (M78 family)
MEPGRDAWELLQRVWMTKGPTIITLPVDPIELSQKSGIRVLDDDELAPEVSGVLRKEPGSSDPTILLNATDTRAPRRFTCAHALGHHTRNAEMRRDGRWEFVEGRDFFATAIGDAEESYASEFAAELLMPWAALRELDDDSTVASLASFFGVTADVMGFRLDRLGWARR